ncbi:hypothetical protein [Falsiroseomonas stagni]|uniref:Uncharacterized protein n=1 Tax=Falsiroseomonas stagni DSM 19981 TaxID=1123062 RepID=A0A1I4C1G8_9PROT|nr:hypothetical protein [Falsiroseomonas stagni]SFK74490.1 hypothetical protein SAMN02745775_106303 [Falsiroseomonas stagni DSM 19981]
MIYWMVVGLLALAEWYRADGHHIRNRAMVATLTMAGGLLLGVPLLFALGLAAATWFWAMIPLQWPRASAAAGIAAGAGITGWALGLSLS